MSRPNREHRWHGVCRYILATTLWLCAGYCAATGGLTSVVICDVDDQAPDTDYDTQFTFWAPRTQTFVGTRDFIEHVKQRVKVIRPHRIFATHNTVVAQALGATVLEGKPDATVQYRALAEFIARTGIGDRKYTLVYQKEYGPTYDDMVRKFGINVTNSVPCLAVQCLRRVLSTNPETLILATPTLIDVETGERWDIQRQLRMVHRLRILDLSIYRGATISSYRPRPKIVSKTLVEAPPIIQVDTKRLDTLDLKQVYVSGYTLIGEVR